MAAAKGGWPVCDPVLRLAGAAYGGSKETSTTVSGDEGSCVVCNAESRLFADCLLLYDGVRRRRQVCSVQFAKSRLFADCILLYDGVRRN